MDWSFTPPVNAEERLDLGTGCELVIELRGHDLYIGVDRPDYPLHTSLAKLPYKAAPERTYIGAAVSVVPKPKGLAVYDCGHLRGYVDPEELALAAMRLKDGMRQGRWTVTGAEGGPADRVDLRLSHGLTLVVLRGDPPCSLRLLGTEDRIYKTAAYGVTERTLTDLSDPPMRADSYEATIPPPKPSLAPMTLYADAETFRVAVGALEATVAVDPFRGAVVDFFAQPETNER